MKYDDFLATVGDWGKYQKVKYTLICLTYMLPPIMVYTYTFTAATPNFRCQNPSVTSDDMYTNAWNTKFDSQYKPTNKQCQADQGHLSLSECQRCFLQTGNSNEKLERCDDYVFDKTFYKRTLVEEVKIRRLTNDENQSLFFVVGYGL